MSLIVNVYSVHIYNLRALEWTSGDIYTTLTNTFSLYCVPNRYMHEHCYEVCIRCTTGSIYGGTYHWLHLHYCGTCCDGVVLGQAKIFDLFAV